MRIKIQVLPTDAVAQWVEHRRDKPRTWVQILASAIFLFVPLRSFFLCYPGEALEGPISTGVCKNSTMLIQIVTYKYEKLLCYIYILMHSEIYMEKMAQKDRVAIAIRD